MSSRSRAIARTSARILANDPAPHVVMIVLPLIFTAFLGPAMAAQLHAAGYAGASGAQQLIPGMSVLFAFMSCQTVCTLFFREHYWGTWERLRASGARSWELMVGKSVPLFVLMLGQMALLYGAGVAFFGFRVHGSVVALALLMVGIVVCVLTFSLMAVALFATLDQAMVVGSLGGMVMAGLGGALAPATSLPVWAQDVAHVMPTYWALDGIHRVTLDGAGLGDVLRALGAMAAFALVCGLVAAWRFNPTETKNGTT